MKTLVTGASGFIGKAVAERLTDGKNSTVAALRHYSTELPADVQQVIYAGLTEDQNWAPLLKGVEAIVHCAARVHVMTETAENPLNEFRKVNVEGTLRLARQAASAGVKRFIFLSSIKVNGESTPLGRPFKAGDMPAPRDPYGISKLEAELALQDLSKSSGLDIVIIRPVLVYGPGVKANFRQLIHFVSRGIPLPFGLADNKRSLVMLDNLVDLIATCLNNPAANNQTFLVSDGNDLSTAQLIKSIAKTMNQPPRLIPVPTGFLNLIAIACGKRTIAERLLGSLQVNIDHTRETLGWNPPVTTQDGLKKTVDSLASP
ncbi:SDR family oxidoreductase [Pelagicoccus sp. SDUM812002]|uniref:UDP-glucose 4-epimerase family protein n=1 Tax=Pelagicoccus sp. SDUM812002 TaxID=3041266 RepID=UPI00280E23B8|nr:SDR family oxidoreductase [Pelagicoccus sp. SDUM812002]MDQ8186277.1 SDR family oxidoreductase [Pelagicoccus sp. SDUM812002]